VIDLDTIQIPDGEIWASPPFPLTDLQTAYMVGTTRLIELGGFRPTWFVDIDAVGFDPIRADAALHHLIDLHEQLRTVMTAEGGQRVLSGEALALLSSPLAVHDLTDLTAEEQAAALRDSHERLYATGPDPNRWPLFHVHAFRMRTHRWRIQIVLSLLLLDGHGIRQVMADWTRLYADLNATLPQPATTYREIRDALLAAEDTDAYRDHWAYWQRRLDTLPDAPALPLAVRPDAIDPVVFRRRSCTLTRAQWQRLCRNFRTHRIMPTTALLHIFTEVLGGWAATPRFCLNILHQNWASSHPQAQTVVGQFGASIPLEVDLTGDTDFWARGRLLQRQLWSDLVHADVSGVKISRELAKQHGWTSRAAFPYVFTSMIGSDGSAPAAPGLSCRTVATGLRTPHVLVDNQVQDDPGGGVACVWDVVDAAFPTGLPDMMFGAYRRMLLALADHDDPPAPPVPTPASHLATIADLNPPPVNVPAGRLEDGFLQQATLRPEAPAVITLTRTLTYRQLLELSRTVADRLRECDIGPGEVVPIVMAKGWEQIVAALGVLQAGAAYCPIDSALPDERIRHIVEACDARAVLDQSARPYGASAVATLHVDQLDASVRDRDSEPEATSGGDPDLAYVIYTSGSTGAPKGVMIEHRAALNTIVDINRRIALTQTDRVFAISSLSFDLSVWDVFGTLSAGAALVVPEASAQPDPAAWAAFATVQGVTIWNSVPALAEMLTEAVEDAGSRTGAPPLRTVLLSGDWIPIALPERMRGRWPDLSVVAMGGATEAAIWSNVFIVDDVDPAWRSIPYGRPLTNQTMTVLDHALRVRAPWATGRIHIGGAGLARGYWRDDTRTSEKFIAHPGAGERLYVTGDLGRYHPDGTIEFLGREDRQLKIQGFRVEPGEVEAAVRTYPGVWDCAVCVQNGAAGQRRLIAFVVTDQHDAGSAIDAHLRSMLPHYMIPAQIHPIPALPLNANGKVDVARALAAVDAPAPAAAGSEDRVPDALHARVTALWNDVLGVSSTTIDTDFFTAGGNSLLALRLVQRIRTEFGVDLPLGQVFEAPTIRSLTDRIGAGRPSGTCAVRLRGGTGPILVLFHPVGGSIAAYRSIADTWSGPVHTFQARALVDHGEDAFDADLETMAAAYRREMPYAQDGTRMVIGGWSMGGVIAHEVGRQLAALGRAVEVVMIDSDVSERRLSQTPFEQHREFLGDLGDGHLPASLWAELERADAASVPDVGRAIAAEHGLLPTDINVADYRRLVRLHAHNLGLLASYRPGPSNQRTILHVASQTIRLDPVPAWRDVCSDLQVEIWPDDHYSIIEPPQLAAIVARLFASPPRRVIPPRRNG
jgi:amino acid adenylation domain-containing protein